MIADFEDPTSEVFLADFTGLPRFSGGQGEFRSGVFTSAHLCRPRRRSGQR